MSTGEDNAPRRTDRPSDASPARATRRGTHEGLTITVTATRRVTGVTLVVTEVAGGPEGLKRNFYTISPQGDPDVACEHALAQMRRVLDDATAPRAAAA